MSLELAEVVGHLASINRFPVEPLGGETPDAVLLRDGVLVGDRTCVLEDAGTREALTLEANPQLASFSVRYVEDLIADEFERWSRVKAPSGKEYPLTDPGWLAEAEKALGRRARTAQWPAQSPRSILLISRPTLRLAERTYGAPLERERVRANLIIEIPEGKAFVENGWIGQKIRIGDALLEITGGRSSIATYEPSKGEGDPSLLVGLAAVRGGFLGVAARALKGLRLRAGDPVVLA